MGHERFLIATRLGRLSSGTGLRLRFFVLIFVCFGLLVLSRLDHSMLRSFRWKVTEAMTPILSALMLPFEPVRDFGKSIAGVFELNAEVERLKQENKRLAGWEWRARELERRVAELQKLTKTVQAEPMRFVTSRVVGDASGAFTQSIIINAGTSEYVRNGYPVISADGLIGRIVDTAPDAARILLLTDANSRIPVLVGDSAVRAILVGDNGAAPRLMAVDPGTKFSDGDFVETSGSGGLFPKGLKIGRVVYSGKSARVAISAKLHDLDYVSVIYFDSSTLDVVEGSRPSRKEASNKSAADTALSSSGN